MTREDHFTNTPEDAAEFERRYNPGYDDRPSLHEMLEDSYPTAHEWDEAETDDRRHGIEHPPWCTRPPGHDPWWIQPLPGVGLLIENCEPAHA